MSMIGIWCTDDRMCRNVFHDIVVLQKSSSFFIQQFLFFFGQPSRSHGFISFPGFLKAFASHMGDQLKNLLIKNKRVVLVLDFQDLYLSKEICIKRDLRGKEDDYSLLFSDFGDWKKRLLCIRFIQ